MLSVCFALTSCERPDPQVTIVAAEIEATSPPTPVITPHVNSAAAPPTPVLAQPSPTTSLPDYFGTPTPDPPHAFLTEGSLPSVIHSVSAGETLGYIAQVYGVTLESLLEENEMSETDFLVVGQQIRIPDQIVLSGPSFKIVPDSGLVYGPAAKEFDVREFAENSGGYLATHNEMVEGRPMDGPEIVSLVAHRYSVGPRLLLALLEYRTGWVTGSFASDTEYPLSFIDTAGLYNQLGSAANALNWGFYGRSEGGVTSLILADGSRLAFAADINDGTAGVQSMMGADDDATLARWLRDVGSDGLFATYSRLFGNPFAFTVDPLWPQELNQPPLRLPWESSMSWFYTGGPHGAWASGSAWAALDFAPPEEELGACQSDHWVTSMADGIVTRSDMGAVVVDMDGDNYAGTGWAVLHMHLDSRERIPVGSFVQAGDRLGHPSCEGGFSNAKHVHVARSYNGRWVAADGLIPFELGGWLAVGLGNEYDGKLVRAGVIKEACDGCREESSQITAD